MSGGVIRIPGSGWTLVSMVLLLAGVASPLGAQVGDVRDVLDPAVIPGEDAYYWLFVSFDACCRGAENTYNVRVGRSESITGPYVDKDGVLMTEGALYWTWDGWPVAGLPITGPQ